jgi:hypothetical protein
MLFSNTYSFREPVTEESLKRFMHLFSQWQYPKGVARKAHYTNVDGSGGIVIYEADTAEAVFEASGPWHPWLAMRIVPILEIEAAVPITMKIHAWRDSFKK